MRLSLFAFFIVMLTTFVCDAQSADPKAIDVSPIAKTSTGGQRWALVIGINNYHNLPKLRFACQDAQAIFETLQKSGFPKQNIILMTDQLSGPHNPTRGNLRARIGDIATGAQRNDTLLIFFSGHGMEKNGQGYLVPIDGSSTDLGSLIPLEWVKTTLNTCAATHRLLILDACHSGAKAGDSPASALLSPLEGAAFATLSSCDVDQLSYEDEENSHGVFTTGIVDGLGGNADRTAQGNSDGTITAHELWAYASLKTRQWGLSRGKRQTPVLKGDFKGQIELTRFKTARELAADRDAMAERLKKMESIARNDASEQLRKEIAQLESQLSAIGGGTGAGISGDAELAYIAAEKRMADLETLLAETLKTHRPTSKAVAKIQAELSNAKTQFNNAALPMVQPLKAQIRLKEEAYDELTRELLPSAPAAKKLKAEIDVLCLKLDSLPVAVQITAQLGRNPKIGDSITNSIGMKLTYIPSGTFEMGSPSSESKRVSDEGPVHTVHISKPFMMSVTEVTQKQYEDVMGANPSNFKGSNNPVECVSWNDAVEFCRKLSQREGKRYRLPTEAQWEYACRAGTTTPYYFGSSERNLDDYAWYSSNSDSKTHSVGTKKPNAWGLYDMYGNVWEWCNDWYADKYPSGRVTDPTGPSSGSYRVLRGGSWNFDPWYCRSANRLRFTPDNRNNYLRFTPDYRNNDNGFRIILDLSY